MENTWQYGVLSAACQSVPPGQMLILLGLAKRRGKKKGKTEAPENKPQ